MHKTGDKTKYEEELGSVCFFDSKDLTRFEC
jgi:hypothetical protein